MSVEPMDVPTPHQQWVAEDEIDLRQYLEVLLRWWREIVGLTLAAVVLAAAGVLVLRQLQTPLYAATASVAIVRTISDVNFDPRFRITSEDSANGTAATARRSALVSLATSGAIAQAVAAELGDILSEEERQPGTLVEMVTAELARPEGSRTTDSDLIRITVEADSPEKAAAIANTWARIYVDQVNTVYGQVPDELLNSIQTELAKAQEKYQQSQAQLEQFIAQSRVDELNRLVAEKQDIIDNLQRGKRTAIAALVDEAVKARQEVIAAYLEAQTRNQLVAFNKEQEGQRALVTAYLDAVNNTQVQAFQQQVERIQQALADASQARRRALRLVGDAQALREQVANGGPEGLTSSAQALQVLKLQSFTQLLAQNTISNIDLAMPEMTAPQSLQIQAPDATLQFLLETEPNLTVEGMLADIDALIDSLNARITRLDQQIESLTTQALSGDVYQHLGEKVPSDSELIQAIQEQYPQLFQTGDVAALSEAVGTDNPLATLAREKAAALLELKELQSIPDFSTEDQPLSQAIAQLEGEVQGLKAQLEAETARGRELTQARDLNWETLKTLNSKVAELNLARAAAGSEVRLAASAIPPAEPVPTVRLLMVAGAAGAMALMLSIFVAFVADFLGKEPFFANLRRQSSPAAG